MKEMKEMKRKRRENKTKNNFCFFLFVMKALVHVSSTYAHCDKFCVKETVYPAEIDWRKTIEMAENVDEHILDILTTKYVSHVIDIIFLQGISSKELGNYFPDTWARYRILTSSQRNWPKV